MQTVIRLSSNWSQRRGTVMNKTGALTTATSHQFDLILRLLMSCCSLSVRGFKSDSAVLCTGNESFEMKEAETSNSLLLLPECQMTAQALGSSTQPTVVSRQVRTVGPSLRRFVIYLLCKMSRNVCFNLKD